jgi:hypothetical protein
MATVSIQGRKGESKMHHAQNGLNFEWGIDENIVWIVDCSVGLPATAYMDDILSMLSATLGSLVDVNILCKSIMGRWDAVHVRHGSRGYDFSSLGDVKLYEDAKKKIISLFGAGASVATDGPWIETPQASTPSI